MAANSSQEYTFQTPYDFTAPNNYNIRLAVHNTNDQNSGNDTLDYIIRNLPNDPIDLSTAVSENLEAVKDKEYLSSFFGLNGLDAFDYENHSSSERLRIGSAYTQNKTKTFELIYSSKSNAPPQNHSITATYNLSQFDTAKHSVALDFTCTRQYVEQNTFDTLFVRGSDTDEWITIEDFFPANFEAVTRNVYGIRIGDFLRANGQNFSSSFQIRWAPAVSYNTILIDNIKLYNTTADVALLSIDSLATYSCGLTNKTPIKVSLQNNSRTAVNNQAINYTINNGPVVSEFVSLIPAQTPVSYTFKQPADLSAANAYAITVWIENSGDSFKENNQQVLTIHNQPLISSFPFIEDFEKSNGGLYTDGTKSSWQYGTPATPRINGGASGKNAWKTNLNGYYNADERSYLYMGCYDLSQLSKPVISLSLALNTDSCSIPISCDAGRLEYSSNGQDWKIIPSTQSLYNWPSVFASRSYNRWHVSSLRLPDTLKNTHLRFIFRSDGYNNYEGIGIDDIHLYDSSASIYDAPSSTSTEQLITGGQQWVEFRKDGKILAAIQPKGQNLGNMQLQTFIHPGSTRHFHGQYYVDRNFSFNTANPIADSILLRLYFTDKEVDSLLFSKACITCTKPKNAYQFGVSSYTSAEVLEIDSSIFNNLKGRWNFITRDKIKTVPYSNGYYIEFTTKDISEIRLSNGGLNGKNNLPTELATFNVQQTASNVIVQWQTASEINIDHFEIEIAKGNSNFQSGQFEKIGDVKSLGRSTTPQSYVFNSELEKTGANYYRVKIVDAFGNYTYSSALPVLFTEELQWQVYPNPSSRKFNLTYQSAPADIIHLNIYNSIGSLIKNIQLPANGFIQTEEIELGENFPAGIYFIKARSRHQTHLLKLIKR